MVYDCFIFFNELDLLELRLNILDGVVDKFVLVEATKSFQGKDKPLWFSENTHRFKEFLDKIIHVVVDRYPDNPEQDPWKLECHQRSMIQEGLNNCDPDDVILISDVDEIPDPTKIARSMSEKELKILRHRMFYYFLNCLSVGDPHNGHIQNDSSGTVMVRFGEIRNRIQELRELSMILPPAVHRRVLRRLYWNCWMFRNATLKGFNIKFIENAGWHFSFLGGVERIIEKLESFSHTEYNEDQFKDPKKIEEAISTGTDIFGRNFRYRFIPIDASYPEYLLKNIDKYPHLIRKQGFS